MSATPQNLLLDETLCVHVVICGAVPSSVRSVRLYSECSRGVLRIEPGGRVWANDTPNPELDRFSNLTMRAKDLKMELTIFAEESQLFLCFNKRWKLIGSKRYRGAMCQFHEQIVNGYSRYRSVENQAMFIGFTPTGRPLRSQPTHGRQMRCINFMKYDNKFSIRDHNEKIAGNMAEIVNSYPKKMAGLLSAKKIRHKDSRLKNKKKHRKPL